MALLELDQANLDKVLLDNDLLRIFTGFENHGIKTLKYLRKRLRRKEGVRHYARELNVSEELLKVLRKQLENYVPKAKPLSQLHWVDKIKDNLFMKSLKMMRITNTFQIF